MLFLRVEMTISSSFGVGMAILVNWHGVRKEQSMVGN